MSLEKAIEHGKEHRKPYYRGIHIGTEFGNITLWEKRPNEFVDLKRRFKLRKTERTTDEQIEEYQSHNSLDMPAR